MTDSYHKERIEPGLKEDTEADLGDPFRKGVVTLQKTDIVDYSELLLYLKKYPKEVRGLAI